MIGRTVGAFAQILRTVSFALDIGLKDLINFDDSGQKWYVLGVKYR